MGMQQVANKNQRVLKVVMLQSLLRGKPKIGLKVPTLQQGQTVLITKPHQL